MSNKSNKWYNEKIGDFIDDLPLSSNILETYDNVTYNAALYIFPYPVQKELDESRLNTVELAQKVAANKKLILAQTGLTTKFNILSFSLKSVFGNNTMETNILTYECNIKVEESLGCNFSNELALATKYLGYEGYFERPVWFEIWFSGYEKSSGVPIEKIPLPNGCNSIILSGYFGEVKSNITHLGSEWNIQFIPYYKSLFNDKLNYLSTDNVIKTSTGMTIEDFFKSHIKNVYNKYIRSFPIDENSANDVIGKYYGKDPNNYIKIEFIDNKGKPFEKINEVKLESNLGNPNSKNGDIEFKTSVDSTFTLLANEFLLHSEKHKHFNPRYVINSEVIGHIFNRPLHKHHIKIILEENEVFNQEMKMIDEAITNKNISDEQVKRYKRIVEEAKYQLVLSAHEDKTLLKKYQFAFSGEDTSVIELMNKQEMLYYLPAIESDRVINLNTSIKPPHTTNKKSFKVDIPDKFMEDKLEADILLEEFYKDNKDRILDGDLKDDIVLYNDEDGVNLLKNNSSVDVNKDIRTLNAKTLYERFYKSAGMSTVKLELLGDPYWISLLANNQSPKSNEYDYRLALPINFITASTCRFVFILKTSQSQGDGNPFDYTYEDAIYVSGIYLATECISNFEGGKFVQTLSGVLDPSLIETNLSGV